VIYTHWQIKIICCNLKQNHRDSQIKNLFHFRFHNKDELIFSLRSFLFFVHCGKLVTDQNNEIIIKEKLI